MHTAYIHFCQQYQDPVWGLHALPWITVICIFIIMLIIAIYD